MDWLLLGTGPSRDSYMLPANPRVRLASVNNGCNAGRTKLPLSAYGVFELTGASLLKDRISWYRSQPGCTVYLRPWIADSRGYDYDDPKVVRIPNDFGPASLKHLHKETRFMPEEDPTVPEYGQRVAWMSSGVLMLWLVAHYHKPERLYILGLDGYPPEPSADDYAVGMGCLFPGIDEFAPLRRKTMNARMADAIHKVTNHPDYSKTEFILLNQPRHDTSDWNVRMATPEDFAHLGMEKK